MDQVLESIIQTPNGINHSLIDDLLSGEKVVSELSYEDSVILEQAMFEKLKSKYQSIYEGFSLDGELEESQSENRSGEMVTSSPTNRITKNAFFFDFEVAKWDHLFFRASFDNRDDEHGYTKEIPRKFWTKEVHKPCVTKFDIRVKNGVDQGNAYGTKTDTVQRSYKVKSLKLIMERLEGFLDTFNQVADEKRPFYQKKIKEDKAQALLDERIENQKKFKKIHDHYGQLKELAVQYGVEYETMTHLPNLIVTKGKAELRLLKKSGSTFWIDADEERYTDYGVFAL